MPLPSDEQILKTSESLVSQLKGIFGTPGGFRPAHAHGVLVSGTFTPTSEAGALSLAQHFNTDSTSVTVRFSSSTGVPQIPDTDPNANPRGIAIRFDLGGRKHTDIVAHSTPYFPTRTGAEFLEMLKAIAASPPGTETPSPIEKFLGAHPSALAFVKAPKPSPSSFARETFYSVNAFKFVSKDGESTHFRYRVLPDAGEDYIDESSLKEKNSSYLFDDLPTKISEGPIIFSLMAQIAEAEDTVDDATVHWPEGRKLVKLGTLKLESMVADDAAKMKVMIYDPIPRLEGLEPSDDPLLEMRAAVYLISGRQRRAAEAPQVTPH